MPDNQTTVSIEMTDVLRRESATYDNSPRSYRNARIAGKRRKGATYQELADEFSISVSRAKQIVAVQERRRLNLLEQVNAPLQHVIGNV